MPILRECETCGRVFSTYPSAVARGQGRFCRKPCIRDFPSLESRFWAKVDKRGPDECWPYTAYCGPRGYGRFGIGSSTDDTERIEFAHRVAFKLTHGRWPEPCCLHECDQPRCCNPRHLREGTQLENIADMHIKGRQAPPTATAHRGEYNGSAKLTEADVREIRATASNWKDCRRLARRFGCSPTTIHDIIRRRTWTHLF